MEIFVSVHTFFDIRRNLSSNDLSVSSRPLPSESELHSWMTREIFGPEFPGLLCYETNRFSSQPNDHFPKACTSYVRNVSFESRILPRTTYFLLVRSKIYKHLFVSFFTIFLLSLKALAQQFIFSKSRNIFQITRQIFEISKSPRS